MNSSSPCRITAAKQREFQYYELGFLMREQQTTPPRRLGSSKMETLDFPVPVAAARDPTVFCGFEWYIMEIRMVFVHGRTVRL